MPVITEKMLRKMEKEGILDKIHITEKDILTPSAKEFLDNRKINFTKEKNVKPYQKAEKLNKESFIQKKDVRKEEKPERVYKDYITG